MGSNVTIYSINGSCSDAIAAMCAHLALDAELRQRKHFEQELTAINPDRTVPTVVTDDGLVLTETSAILNHLARCHAVELLGRGAVERAKNEEMCSFVATGVYSAFLMRFRPDRYADNDEAKTAIREKAGVTIGKALDSLEARLASNTFAVGEHLTTSDFFILVMMNWAERVDPALLQKRPGLLAYWQRLRDMPFYSKAFDAAAA